MDTPYDDDEERLREGLYNIDGGPRARPKPLYNDGLVQSIAALVDAGARLLEASHSKKAENDVWALFQLGKKLVEGEDKRRRDKNKQAQNR